jgi:hypothetical protein
LQRRWLWTRREPTHALQRDGKSLSLDQPPGSLLYRHLSFQLSLSNRAFWISINLAFHQPA